MKWKSEEDKLVGGGKKDKSAEEKAEEGEEKALAAVQCLFALPSFECNFCNTDNNGANPH